MSIRALCIGVRDHLRNVLRSESKVITYHPIGEPPPTMGQKHVVVSHGGYTWAGKEGGDGDDRNYAITVGVFFKIAYSPDDRVGQLVLEEGSEHLLDLTDRIPGWLVNNWTPINLANAQIVGFGSTTNGFIEPFMSASCGPLETTLPPWLKADNPPTILRQRVTLRGPRRIRVDTTVV